MPGHTSMQKDQMLLRKETRDGLKITDITYNYKNATHVCMYVCICILLKCIINVLLYTVLSFTELAPKLLSLPGVKFLLSERFTQDSFESYFGKQCARGRYNDNPSVQEFMDNADVIRVVQNLGLEAFGGNVRGRKQHAVIEDIERPLPRRTGRHTRRNSS